MIVHFLIFIAALAFLAKGADFFVEYAARLAKRFGVSDFVIGLTITSVGTSVPELAASVSASLQEHSGLIIGNVVGSNIANIGLILGLSAIIKPFKTETNMYQRDGYIMIASVILFFAISLNNYISEWEAGIFILSYIFYVLFLLRSNNEGKAYYFRDFMHYVFDFEYITPIKSRLFKSVPKQPGKAGGKEEKSGPGLFDKAVWKDISITLLSCVAVMLGARYLVQEAVWIAQLIHVPESVIGLSMIAIGTSLPELTVSISAVRKGKGGMVVGNVIGSNIANVLLIIGVSGIVFPLKIAEISVVYTLPILLFFSLAFLYFIRSDWEIKRSQGWIAVTAYVLFMVLAFIMGWS